MLRPTAGGIGGVIYWSQEDHDRWSREMAEESSESPFAAAKRLHAAAQVLEHHPLHSLRFPKHFLKAEKGGSPLSDTRKFKKGSGNDWPKSDRFSSSGRISKHG